MTKKLMFLVLSCLAFHGYVDAFTPEEARRVYGEASWPSASSNMEIGDYVFMELKWKQSPEASAEEREAQELSSLMNALQKYVSPEPIALTNVPFCKELMTWLTPETDVSIPEVASTTVKMDEENGEHRIVVAYDALPLRIARRRAAANRIDINRYTAEDWTRSLLDAFANFEADADKRKFFYMLGCPIVNLILHYNGDDFSGCACGPEKSRRELEDIKALPHKEESFFSGNGGIDWTSVVKRTRGSFYPYWREFDNGQFLEAKDLYRRGKNVPRILKLLKESISINPVSSEKWGYLGGALKVAGRNGDAIIAYIQALRFDTKNKSAWKGLRECCGKCGFHSNANGLTWFLRMKEIE